MKITIGYKTWDTKDWVITKDLGSRFLFCPDCGCGILLDPYNMACGTEALNFCPYCGQKRSVKRKLQTSDRQITLEDIFNRKGCEEK